MNKKELMFQQLHEYLMKKDSPERKKEKLEAIGLLSETVFGIPVHVNDFIPKSSRMFKKGDVLVNGSTVIDVLGVCGDVIFTSYADCRDECSKTFDTQVGLERRGWRLKTKEWMPQIGEKYLFVLSDGEIQDTCSDGDLFRLKTRNCFENSTWGREQAKKWRDELLELSKK